MSRTYDIYLQDMVEAINRLYIQGAQSCGRHTNGVMTARATIRVEGLHQNGSDASRQPIHTLPSLTTVTLNI